MSSETVMAQSAGLVQSSGLNMEDGISESEAWHEYRAYSAWSIAGLIFGILSVSAFIHPVFNGLGVMGLIFALIGLIQVRRSSGEFIGEKMAKVALILCLVILPSNVAMHTLIYIYEVPEGYDRVSWTELQPKPSEKKIVSERSLELAGTTIFIPGYVYPGSKLKGLKEFVLVPDMGTCCFGGTPKATDMILVKLKEGITLDYSLRRRKLGGVLTVNEKVADIAATVEGSPGVHYILDADYLK
ncbi:MAG: DUF3299 domain-containing protein [Pirellulaceae bacterium]|nr:DUF3299 domain-containing protein [Pirellulaceae bacterium]